MKISLILRKDKKNKHGLSPLIIQISDGKYLNRISTGFSSLDNDFDEKKQLFKTSYPNSSESNSKLNNIKYNIEVALLHYNEIVSLTRFKPIQGCKPEIFKLIYDEVIKSNNIEPIKEAIVSKYNTLGSAKKPNQLYIPRNLDVKKLAKLKDIAYKISLDETNDEIDQILQLEVPIHQKEPLDKLKEKKLEKEFKAAWNKYEEFSKLKHKESTYSRIPNNLKKLEGFCKYKNLPLTFEVMNDEFGMYFKNYLETEDYNYIKDKKGQSDGTVHNIMKSISTFLNWAVKNKFHTNMSFKNWDTRKPTTDLHYLNENQLVALKNLSLKQGSSYDVSRDLFLFSCYTGMRYSDIENWKATNIKDDVIKFKSVKTQKNCIVGISPVVRSILSKYSNKLPVQANQKINYNIKEILYILEFNYDVQKKMRYGKIEEITELPFSKVITFHSGRRTFINLMLSKGVGIAHLSTMTGNTLNSLMVYYKNDPTEIRRIVENINFME